MTKRLPPVPPEQRSPKEPGDQARPAAPRERDPAPIEAHNLEGQGRRGNIRQNTRDRGHQQDR